MFAPPLVPRKSRSHPGIQSLILSQELRAAPPRTHRPHLLSASSRRFTGLRMESRSPPRTITTASAATPAGPAPCAPQPPRWRTTAITQSWLPTLRWGAQPGSARDRWGPQTKRRLAWWGAGPPRSLSSLVSQERDFSLLNVRLFH